MQIQRIQLPKAAKESLAKTVARTHAQILAARLEAAATPASRAAILQALRTKK